MNVDKEIPIPRKQRKHAKWPWHELEVGDSFLMPEKSINAATAHANTASKSTGHKYTCRTVEGGVRIWRVK